MGKSSQDINCKKSQECCVALNPLYFKTRGSSFDEDYILNELPNTEEFNSEYEECLSNIKKLWSDNKGDLDSLDEPQLEREFIRPILELLGWSFEVQARVSISGKDIIPDYALFTTNEDKIKSRKAKIKFSKAVAVGDAKKWDEDLDGKSTYQITNYMYHTKKDFGILTNGRHWRIYYQSVEFAGPQYYEIDLEKILCSIENGVKKAEDRFKYFYLFFRKDAFISEYAFLRQIIDKSQKHSRKLNDNLKEDVLPIVEKICNGFIKDAKKLKDEDLSHLYENSMYFAFRLIFILNCEDREILEVNKTDDYFKDYSLRKKCIDIKNEKDNGDHITWSKNSSSLYNSINSLFNALKEGTARHIGVQKFNGDIFQSGSAEFYKSHPISNQSLKEILLGLTYLEDKRIDYKLLDVDHIGSIFEGLLENKPALDGDAIILVNDKGERKGSGTYYTPTFIVNHLVENSLEKKVQGCKDVEDILNLKVCDPCCGSGHFILGFVRYLEKKIYEKQAEKNYKGNVIDGEKIKSEILYKCCYAIDTNSIAIELAKLSCYIEVAHKNHTFKCLKNRFKCGDSLLDSYFPLEFELPEVFGENVQKGFDAISSNPPWAELNTDEDHFWIYKFPKKKIIRQKGKEKILKTLRKENPSCFQQFQSQKIQDETYRTQLRAHYDLKEGDTDLYKAFCWRFLELCKEGGNIGIVIPRTAFNSSGHSSWRKKILDDYDLKKLITLENKSRWVFKNVVEQYTIALVSIEKTKGRRKKIETYGIYSNLKEFKAIENIKPMKLEDLKKNNKHLIIPSFNHSYSVYLFNKMSLHPKMTSNSFNFKFRFVTEFHATNEKKHFVRDKKNLDHEKKYLDIYKGSSFDIWNPNTKKHYDGLAEENYIQDVLFKKRLRASKNKRSAFYGIDQKIINNKSTLPLFSTRIIFRGIASRLKLRTIILNLCYPNKVLTNGCPYFYFTKGDKKDESYILGVLNSMIFDWYARCIIELNLNYHFFDYFSVPQLVNDSPVKKEIIRIAGILSAQDKRFESWAKEVGVKPIKLTEERKNELIFELDALVAKAYRLNEDDIRHIYKTFHRNADYSERCEKVLEYFSEVPELDEAI